MAYVAISAERPSSLSTVASFSFLLEYSPVLNEVRGGSVVLAFKKKSFVADTG